MVPPRRIALLMLALAMAALTACSDSSSDTAARDTGDHDDIPFTDLNDNETVKASERNYALELPETVSYSDARDHVVLTTAEGANIALTLLDGKQEFESRDADAPVHYRRDSKSALDTGSSYDVVASADFSSGRVQAGQIFAAFTAGQRNVAGNGTGSDNGGSDNGGSDNGGSDNGGSDNGGSDNGGSDNGGSENDGSDNDGSEHLGAGIERNFYGNAGTYLGVLPPGESPDQPSSHYADQSKLYQALEYAPKGLQTSALRPSYYKSERFNPPDTFSASQAIASDDGALKATVDRDPGAGVPHIYADNRPGVMFGIGYASAEDRLFFLDVLRHMGRGRLSDFTGPNLNDPFSGDRSSARRAGYSEAELQEQVDQSLERFDAAGAQVRDDVKNYIKGVNRYIAQIKNNGNMPQIYSLAGIKLRKFTVRDLVGITTLVEARFGSGGGGEIADAQLLNGIDSAFADYSNAQKCGLWHDILQSNDPTRPVTTTQVFETQSPKTVDTDACPLEPNFSARYAGAALIDPGSYRTGGTTLTRQPCTPPEQAESPTGGAMTCPNYEQSVVAPRYVRRQGDGAGSQTLSQPGVVARAAFARLGRLAPALKPASKPHAPRVVIPWRDDEPLLARIAQRRVARVEDKINDFLDDKNNRLDRVQKMSNALLVTAQHAKSNHPIAVFGPQVGYFAPQILFEFEAHGGGINARGVAFPGLPYVVLGRGADFAWSATSASADITDIRVLQLCTLDDGKQGYRYDGSCKAFYERTDRWTAEVTPAAGLLGLPIQKPQAVTRRVVRAPDYGLVLGYATVDGRDVALARQRSTYFHEIDSAVGFMQADQNQVKDPKTFKQIFNKTTGTFNWFYIDSQHITYFMAGLLPKRADGIYPYLPQWGTGDYDWAQKNTGEFQDDFDIDNFLAQSAHPHETDPDRGWLTSWNNAQARGFWAADNEQTYGPVYRVQALNARLEQVARQQGDDWMITPGDLVQIMEDGGFTDLRGQANLPAALTLLRSGKLTTEQQQAIDLLSAWRTDGDYAGLGAWRRDRDQDGEYDNRAAVVLMDAWFPRMLDTALPQLARLENTDRGNVIPKGRDNHPSAQGSAFSTGYYGYLQRTLKTANGTSERPYRQLQCADGTPQGCRQALQKSLDNALSALGGIANKANWDGTRDSRTKSGSEDRTVEKSDMIRYTNIGAPAPIGKPPEPILWVNRPTWQQVVQPTSSR